MAIKYTFSTLNSSKKNFETDWALKSSFALKRTLEKDKKKIIMMFIDSYHQGCSRSGAHHLHLYNPEFYHISGLSRCKDRRCIATPGSNTLLA